MTKSISRRCALKLGFIGTAGAMASLVGCGGSSNDAAASGDASTTQGSYKVALVISGPKNDGG